MNKDIIKLTPDTYLERSKKIFERLSSLIPAMMARIKPEVDEVDEDSKQKVIMAHLIVVDKELGSPTFNGMISNERYSGADIKKGFTTHPDAKKDRDALMTRISKQIRP